MKSTHDFAGMELIDRVGSRPSWILGLFIFFAGSAVLIAKAIDVFF
jgi:hypothetical protein